MGCQTAPGHQLVTDEEIHQLSYRQILNPIGQVFAKLKALLRKAATRTREALWTAIGHLLSSFSPTECRNTSPTQDMRSTKLEKLDRLLGPTDVNDSPADNVWMQRKDPHLDQFRRKPRIYNGTLILA